MEDKFTRTLDDIFNGLAIPTVESQKRLLGITGKMNREQALKMAERIREIFMNLAGNVVADKVYKQLIEIINNEKD